MTISTPTQSQLADFRAFCREATLPQLRAIYEKERDSGKLGRAEP